MLASAARIEAASAGSRCNPLPDTAVSLDSLALPVSGLGPWTPAIRAMQERDSIRRVLSDSLRKALADSIARSDTLTSGGILDWSPNTAAARMLLLLVLVVASILVVLLFVRVLRPSVLSTLVYGALPPINKLGVTAKSPLAGEVNLSAEFAASQQTVNLTVDERVKDLETRVDLLVEAGKIAEQKIAELEQMR